MDANDPRRESVIATIVPYKGNLQFDDEKTREEAPAFTELIANAIRKEAGELSIEITIERPLVISIGPSIKAILYHTLVKCQADRAACPSLIDSYVKSNAAIAKRVSDTTRKSQ